MIKLTGLWLLKGCFAVFFVDKMSFRGKDSLWLLALLFYLGLKLQNVRKKNKN